MALDMKKMRDRMKTLKSKNGNSANFWRPQDRTGRLHDLTDSDPTITIRAQGRRFKGKAQPLWRP